MSQRKPDEKELVSFRFKKSLKNKLASLSEATGRSQTFLVEEALEQYCDYQSWQIAQVVEGIKAADAGELLSTEQVLRHLENKRASGL